MFKYGEATAKILKKHKELDFIKIRWYALVPVISLLLLIFLVISSFYSKKALHILILLIIIYAIADVMTTIRVIDKTRMYYSLISLFLLPMQHILYALGFIKGIFA